MTIMTLIAIEEHWFPPELTAALEALPEDRADPTLAFNARGDNLDHLYDLGAGRLAAMDAQGIDVSIIALTPPGTQALDPAEAVRLSRAANDTAADAVRAHPARLRAMSSVPLSSPEDAAAELERAAGLGHVGTMVYGRSGDRTLDDPAYDDFFATAEALGQPVFIHPQAPPPAVRQASYAGIGPMTDLALATFGWGWHMETGIAALRLILRGTFDRHPGLRVVLGHWGEMLLYWMDRADGISGIAGLERKVSDYVRSNVFITTSGMFNPAYLRHALEVTTIDRLVFSTDHPFQRPAREDIGAFLAEFGSGADREKFTSANASSLYGLEL